MARLFSFSNGFLLSAMLGIMTLLLFSPAIHYGFLTWKDAQALTENSHAKDLSLPHIKAAFKQTVNGVYAPVATLSFALESKLFGFHPEGFHLSNILLHVVVVMLLFFVFKAYGISNPFAFWGAFIFAVSPSIVSSVVHISQRRELLSLFFVLLAVLARGRMWVVLSCLALAFLTAIWNMYAAYALLAGVLACGVERLYRFLLTQEKIICIFFVVSIIVLAFGLTLLSSAEIPIWKDDVSLWSARSKRKATAETLTYLANAYEERGSLSERSPQENNNIIQLYNKALVLDAHFLPAHHGLGDFYKKSGAYAEAISWYKKALVINPKDVHAFLNLGDTYQLVGDDQKAIGTFNDLIKVYPDDEDVYMKVINAYGDAIKANPSNVLYQEKREELLAGFEQLVKRQKYTAVDYFNLGFLYQQVGGKDEAMRYYTKAVALKPNHAQALYNLAKLYQEANDFKSAMFLYERLVHFYPRYAAGYLNMGIMFNALGEHERAKQLYLKVIHLDPDNASAYFNLGYISETEGELRDASNYYEKAIEADPKNGEAYYNLGNVYAALGQNPEAMASYLKTVGLNPNHQNAYVNLSILSFKLHDTKGAIRYLEKAQALGYNPPVEYLKSLEPYR